MKRLSLVFVALVCSGAAPYNPKPVSHEGEAGFWFSREDTLRLLDAAEKLEVAKDVVRDQERIIDLQALQVRTATAALGVQQVITDDTERLAQSWRRLAEDRECSSIWCAREFWFLVGAATVGLTVWGANQ